MRKGGEWKPSATYLIVINTSRYNRVFIVGPKAETGTQIRGSRYHVKNRSEEGWEFEKVIVGDVRMTNTLLGHLVIVKVEDEKRLINLTLSFPVVNDYENWKCRSWIAHALAEIAKDGKCVGTSQRDWRSIEAFAR